MGGAGTETAATPVATLALLAFVVDAAESALPLATPAAEAFDVGAALLAEATLAPPANTKGVSRYISTVFREYIESDLHDKS